MLSTDGDWGCWLEIFFCFTWTIREMCTAKMRFLRSLLLSYQKKLQWNLDNSRGLLGVLGVSKQRVFGTDFTQWVSETTSRLYETHVYKCCEVRNKWREVISLPHCVYSKWPIIGLLLGRAKIGQIINPDNWVRIIKGRLYDNNCMTMTKILKDAFCSTQLTWGLFLFYMDYISWVKLRRWYHFSDGKRVFCFVI